MSVLVKYFFFNFFRPRSSKKGKPITNVSNTERPSNWASMPSNKQYTRVKLSTVSSEYKEVERLFKSSIEKRVVIRRIQRVQNSFMWEKYQRYYLFIYIYICRKSLFRFFRLTVLDT